MKVVKRGPVPIYEIDCPECKSKIEYRAADVEWLHIKCPVCGISMWAYTTNPVRYECTEPPKEDDDAKVC